MLRATTPWFGGDALIDSECGIWLLAVRSVKRPIRWK